MLTFHASDVSRFCCFCCLTVISAALCACGKKPTENAQTSPSAESVAASAAASTVVSKPLAQTVKLDTADSFIANLQAKMKTYNETVLRKWIDEFNAQQLKSHGVAKAGEDLPPLPAGVIQIEFEDLGEHFLLQLREVLTAHSDDVDGGTDQFRSVFFNKSDMTLLTDIPTKSQSMPDTSLRIAIGSQQTCMGDSAGEAYAIFDLKQKGKTYLKEKFQDQVQGFEIKPVKTGTIQLLTRSETDFKGKEKDAQQCEIGSWVDVLETTYTISCDSGLGKCTSQKKQKTYPACSAVGACD
ncbi:MAG: hypothetical protein HYR68_01460 [Burkholderiales bacterium]|nr:hypothetical protein [Burkholderiales bacterium]MBI3729606.1 hypothetical protein [Burkholderiales bacterium]